MKHHKVITVADDPTVPQMLRPSDWGSTSTNYGTTPTHIFDGGTLGALAMRDTASPEGFSWLTSTAGVLVSEGGVPAFRPLLATDIPTLAYSSLSGLPTLGGSAALNVGTSAGTVAAGNHNHAGVYEPAFATLAWSRLTGVPTTLAGYGITDAVALTTTTNTWSGLQTFSGGIALTGIVTTTVAGIGLAPTDGAVLQNTTLATLAIPLQLSPRLRLRGAGWDTDDAVSRTVDMYLEVLPSTGATVGANLRVGYSLNGGAATSPLILNSDGALTITGGLSAGSIFTSGAIQVGAGNVFGWVGGTRLTAGDGLLNIFNNALTVGVGFDVNTDAVLKVRTRVQTGYATVDALAYKVSGVAGASKAAGPVTSITVVNGLVTAIS